MSIANNSEESVAGKLANLKRLAYFAAVVETGSFTAAADRLGITKAVVLDATLNKAAEHPMKKVPAIGFDATASIKRSDFGVGGYAPNVSDEVHLRITTEGMLADAPTAAK